MRWTVLFLVAACTAPVSDPTVDAALRAGAPALLVSVEERSDAVAPFALQTTREGYRTWRSGDGVGISTKAGFLQATRGFGADMLSSDTEQSADRVLLNQPGLAERFHTFIDGEDQAVTRAYVCEITNRGARIIDVGRGPERSRLMAEDCASLTEEFTNLYWVSPNREVLQSRQWAGPFTGPLAIRSLPQ